MHVDRNRTHGHSEQWPCHPAANHHSPHPTMLILADLLHGLLGVTLTIMAIFIILLVLVQRGRGGGLAGALGGMGGSSAFGAKAGDVFTRITIVTASILILLCFVALMWAKHRGDALGNSNPAASSTDDTTLLPK